MLFVDFFRSARKASLKDKISSALRQIDFHRRELETLRLRLESRDRVLQDIIVKTREKGDEVRAGVYSNELAELTKVMRVVSMSELSLTQIVIRFESIRDVGDALLHIDDASRTIRDIGKKTSDLAPSLENATNEANFSLSQTLIELGNIAPDLSLDILNEGTDELVERAKHYAEEKALEIGGMPDSLLSTREVSVLDIAKKVAILATGEEEENTAEFKPTFFSIPKLSSLDEAITGHVNQNNGNLNIIDISTNLQVPIEAVEEAVIKLLSEGSIRLANRGNT